MEWNVIVWCFLFPFAVVYGSLLIALLLGMLEDDEG